MTSSRHDEVLILKPVSQKCGATCNDNNPGHPDEQDRCATPRHMRHCPFKDDPAYASGLILTPLPISKPALHRGQSKSSYAGNCFRDQSRNGFRDHPR